MKKWGLSLVLAMSVIPTVAIHAQINIEPVNSYRNPSTGMGIIPSNYSSTHKPQLYHISRSSDDGMTINLLNPQFECIKSIVPATETVTGYNCLYDKEHGLEIVATTKDSTQYTITSYKVAYNDIRNVLTGCEATADDVSYSESRYDPDHALQYLKQLTGEQISVENENGFYTFLPSSSSKYHLYDQFSDAYPMWYATLDLTGGAADNVLLQHNVTYAPSSTPHYRLTDAVHILSNNTEDVMCKFIGSKKQVYYKLTDATSSYYYGPKIFGNKYLLKYLLLLRDGSLFGISKSYKLVYEEPANWNLISQESVTQYYYPITILPSLMPPGIKSADDFTISQTLFNHDDLFEYILPILEKSDDEVLSEKQIGYQTIPVKQTFARWRIIGYQIINELGNEICRLTLPAGYDGSTSMQLFDYGDEQYLTVDASINVNSDKQTDTFVYKIIRADNNSDIEQIGAPLRTDISPRLVNQSMPIDIRFSDESTQPRQIIVTSTNGITHMTFTLSPQTLSATVDTSRLSPGMYIISVKDGDTLTENCKVIIR